MKVLMIGLGSIGMRHARLLREDGAHTLFALRSGAQHGNELGIPECTTWEEVDAVQPDVAFITNPTHLHGDTARQCAVRGMHLFIEKPLSDRLDGIEELIALCAARCCTAYVAYCLRFHPVIGAMRAALTGKRVLHVRAAASSYLPDWRPGRDHLRGYSASAAMGGGVLLDLSHDADNLAYLFGPLAITGGWCGRVSDVTVDAEDAADLLLQTTGGIPMNLHMNMMSRRSDRWILADTADGYVYGDILGGRIETLSHGKHTEEVFTVDRDAYFRDQLAYFFANIGNPAIMNNLGEASALLRILLACRQCSWSRPVADGRV